MHNTSAVDIIKIAIDIENEGYLYYKACKERVGEKYLKELFGRLMKDESSHKELFSDLIKEAEDKSKASSLSLELSPELHEYYSLIFYKKILNIGIKETEMKSILAILEHAINNEKDSILFYSELKNGISDEKVRKVIGRIIDEERGHVISLVEEYSKRQKEALS